MNLLSNALKFTDTGFVSLLVENVTDTGQLILRFTVEDSGIGQPADSSGVDHARDRLLDRVIDLGDQAARRGAIAHDPDRGRRDEGHARQGEGDLPAQAHDTGPALIETSLARPHLRDLAV